MVNYIQITGFDEFDLYTNNLQVEENNIPVFFYFTGSKTANGLSWCPDCNDAEPVVRAYLDELQTEVVFAYVDVGDAVYWRDKNCPFRTDTRTKLMVIPTIIKWQGVQRLEGSQCTKRELLQMMFEEEE